MSLEPKNLNLCLCSAPFASSQLLEDEDPDYASMVAEIIYILQGSLSLEVATEPPCSALVFHSVRRC
jgi:hypothetical protein